MAVIVWLIIFFVGIGAQSLILSDELLWGLLLYTIAGSGAVVMFYWYQVDDFPQREIQSPSKVRWNVWWVPIVVAFIAWALSVGFIWKASQPESEFAEGYTTALITWLVFVLLCLIACAKDLVIALQQGEYKHWNHRQAYSLVALCLLALCLGLFRLTDVPATVHGDEGMVGLHARRLLNGEFNTFFSTSWYAIPQFFYFVPAVGLTIFGDSLFGLRMSTVMVGVLAVIPFFVLCRLLWGNRAAIFTTILLICNHWFLQLMHSGVNYVQAAFFATTLLLFWFLSYQTRRVGYLILAGLTMGIALLSYQANHLLPILWVASWGWVWVLRQIDWKQFLLGVGIPVVIALMCIAPLLTHLEVVNQSNNMFNTRAQGVVAFTDANINHLNSVYQAGGDPGRIWLNQARQALLAPIAYADTSIQYDGELPMLDVLLSVLFMFGVMIGCYRFYDMRWSVPLWWVLGILIAGGMLTVDPPFFPRLSGMTTILFLMIGGVIQQLLTHKRSSIQSNVLTGFVILVILISSSMNLYYYFGEYANNTSLRNIHYAQTQIAKFMLAQGKEKQYYALEGNHFSIQSGTVQFLTPGFNRQSVNQPPADFPQPGQVFIIPANRQPEVAQWRNQYPEAKFEIHQSAEGRVLFYTLGG